MNTPATFANQLENIVEALSTQGWVVIDDFLSPAEAESLRKLGERRQAAGEFHRAAVGRAKGHAVRDSIRGDNVLWLDPQQPQSAEIIYWERINQLQAALNRHLYLGIREGEFHYAQYPIGSFYRRHLDRFRDDDARVVSVVCYLNAQWDAALGGQLRVWLGQQGAEPSIDVQPIAGRLVVFMSDRFWHEVLSAQRERWSITGWLRRTE
jgi:SM-20-related protein